MLLPHFFSHSIHPLTSPPDRLRVSDPFSDALYCLLELIDWLWRFGGLDAHRGEFSKQWNFRQWQNTLVNCSKVMCDSKNISIPISHLPHVCQGADE